MREPERKSLEDRVAYLVNTTRSRYGLAALDRDERLRRSSRRHCTDMAARRVLAHRLPGCPDPFERMMAEGFPDPAGENVAFGQRTPHQVMDGWMRSRGHRANILNPDFRTIGVGLLRTPRGHWWTQNFGY